MAALSFKCGYFTRVVEGLKIYILQSHTMAPRSSSHGLMSSIIMCDRVHCLSEGQVVGPRKAMRFKPSKLMSSSVKCDGWAKQHVGHVAWKLYHGWLSYVRGGSYSPPIGHVSNTEGVARESGLRWLLFLPIKHKAATKDRGQTSTPQKCTQ